jgi:acyl carrier protein
VSTDVRSAVLAVLGRIAPEADLDALPDDADLREELDIDSIDFLNLMIGIHETLGIDVPEQDYAQCATLAGCVAYLAPKVRPSSS